MSMNASADSYPAQHFDALAEVAKTLGHAHRLVLLEHVAQGERAVERLAELSGLSVANTSQHLQHLRRAGFVQTRRDGKRVLYRLGTGPVAQLLAALRGYAEHQRAEIKEIIADSIHQRDRLDGVSVDELLGLLDSGSVVLLDVRPAEEFALGHLPGAVNIPPEQLEGRLADLPADANIVAYCRGPYCVLSSDAVAALQARGLRARRLDVGFPEWKAAGLRVEAA
ncbi:HTH-type transcriptional regulator KmtR [Achromobacter agilis]|uniref:HTH-type transcriptional regulator KmtR n=2 Tax=Achromobacter agilis TaxID=1353888 RepID=A0A446C2W4_9BURK|nr:metalloregulator ArsR/SmtB family transcription factor [Achromobacter agilis]SSW62218.1 HTH-type transcriptional regulator KmtR [Achromobacter agilis]